MRRFTVLLLFIASAWGQAPDAAEVQRVLKTISEITGFAVKRPVPCESITRQQWNHWLQEELKRRVKPEEIRSEELALKKFGLVPAGFDLRKTTVELLTEQAAAFYDHRKKKMVFVEGSGSMMQSAVLGHELGHALADQHFRLGRFIDGPNKTDDAQAARMAVVEGQAMWLMVEMPLRAMGSSLLKNPAPLEMVMQMSTGSSGVFPVFEGAPLYLRESLLFPYRDGALFQQKVLEKLGQDGFQAVLRDPPSSTQQILHPEKYFDKVQPTSPPLPDFRRDRKWKVLTAGNLGELDLRLLLEQHAGVEAARKQAPHLRGARFDLLEQKLYKATVLRWSSEWDSEEAATSYLRLYKRVLAGKWKKYVLEAETASELTGTGDDGRFEVRRTGATVVGIEGLRLR